MRSAFMCSLLVSGLPAVLWAAPIPGTATLASIRAITETTLSLRDQVLDPEQPIWEAGVSRPAAFSLEEDAPATLELLLNLSGGRAGERCRVEGILDGQVKVFEGQVILKASGEQAVRIRVASGFRPEGPVMLQGSQIAWRLLRRGQAIPLGSPEMELFWVQGADPALFKRGIPVERLREVLQAFPGAVRPQADQFDPSRRVIHFKARETPGPGWTASQVAQWAFNRNPPRYDVWQGANYFTVINSWNNITLKLNSYLNAVNDSSAIANCYDLAAVTQYYLGVAGIKNVKYLYMNPFGYLKQTNLIGRGTCNNPFYRLSAPMVIGQTNASRTAFGNHAFCYLNSTAKVVDACAGPHTGTESAAQYVAAAVDTVTPNPPRVRAGTVNDMRLYTGVTSVSSLSAMAPDVLARGEEGFEAAPAVRAPQSMVVCPWPSPLDSPVLAGGGWALASEELLPGPGESMKAWVLRRGEERLEITLFVSSEGNHMARNRFRSLHRLTSLPDNPFSPSRDAWGERSYSAVSEGSERHLWMLHNVVFDVRYQGAGFDARGLCAWLNDLAAGHARGSEGLPVPALDGLACPQEARVGSELRLSTALPEAVLREFEVEGDALSLRHEDATGLRFKARKATDTTVRVMAVDRRTLLSSWKTFRVRVTP